MTTRISQRSIDLLILWEGGLRLKAYDDGYGVWANGVGHAGVYVVQGLIITESLGRSWLQKGFNKYEELISKVVNTK